MKVLASRFWQEEHAWWIDILGLIFLGICLFMVGNGNYTLFDNSEPHYSRVAQEMVASGDYLTPHFNGHVWHVHPPLYFWLLSAHCSVWGWSDFQLRVIEGVCAIAGLLVVYQIGKEFFNRRTGLLAAVVLAASLYYVVLARLAIFDMVLNTCLLVSIYGVLKALHHSDRSTRYWLLAGVSGGLAVLTKGPIGWVQPALAFLPFIAWQKRWAIFKDSRFWIGVAVSLAIAVPWYAHQLMHYGKEFFDVALKDYTWYRFFDVVEGQKGPWFYYFPVLLGFFPWIFYAAGAVIQAIEHKVWRSAHVYDEVIGFSWLFVGLSFIFFSFAQTKLPNYILSIFPFLSLIIAHYLLHEHHRKGLYRFLTILGPFLISVAWMVSFRFPIPEPYTSHAVLVPQFLAILAAASWGYAVVALRRQIFLAVGIFVTGMLIGVFFLTHTLFPAIEAYKDVRPISQVLRSFRQPYTLIHYHFFSPSILFYANHTAVDTTRIDEVNAIARKAGSQQVFLISDEEHLSQLKESGIKWRPVVRTYRLRLVELYR